MNLTNTRVLIVGGTSGIGLGVAMAVAERGAVPIVASRRQSSVDRALARLPEGAHGAAVDVSDTGALEGFAADVGDVDHLVFTAGDSLQMAKIADLTPEVVSDFFTTRFVGALNTVRVFAPRVRESITMTSGTAAHRPEFGVLPVSVCGAMNAAVTALAFELAPIRVNAVAPGVVRTPLWDSFGDDERLAMFDESARKLPLGRIGEAEDAALAYVYCMEQAHGTGVVLTVDGGTLLV
jgi:NAD(P)-dependent dehydrogenase (short-subunit alcohol dehydrogenase family)